VSGHLRTSQERGAILLRGFGEPSPIGRTSLVGPWLTRNPLTEPASFRMRGGRFSTPCEERRKADSCPV
jgi:hypothetical protein